jgi:hypothetical protein
MRGSRNKWEMNSVSRWTRLTHTVNVRGVRSARSSIGGYETPSRGSKQRIADEEAGSARRHEHQASRRAADR